jgi:hypothetical protein
MSSSGGLTAAQLIQQQEDRASIANAEKKLAKYQKLEKIGKRCIRAWQQSVALCIYVLQRSLNAG